MRRLCPHLFGGVDITRAPQQVFAELREAHARVLERHRRVAAVYAQWDQAGVYWDFDTAGEGHHRFHPDGLADQKELLPLSKFGTDEDYLKHAQRRFSSVIHHSSWLKLLTDLQAVSRGGALQHRAGSQGALRKHRATRWAGSG